MATIVAKTQHLSKSFGDNHVLDDLSVELHGGENLVILGKSGSGKSVFIKCLVGLDEPDSGVVSLFGEDIAGRGTVALNKLRKKIGFLFQNAALYDSMTVRENLEFPLREMKTKTATPTMDRRSSSRCSFSENGFLRIGTTTS